MSLDNEVVPTIIISINKCFTQNLKNLYVHNYLSFKLKQIKINPRKHTHLLECFMQVFHLKLTSYL